MTSIGTPRHGHGHLVLQSIADPGASNDWSYQIPPRRIAIVHAIACNFYSGAGAFTTAIAINCNGPLWNSWSYWLPESIPQLINRHLYLSPNGEAIPNWTGLNRSHISIAHPLWAFPEQTIQSIRTVPSATNVWSEIILTLETWIMP